MNPLLLVTVMAAAPAASSNVELFPALQAYARSVSADAASIPAERKAHLEALAAFIRTQRAAKQSAKLMFICTHNSRRSHMGQLLGALAAAHYGIDGVETFSGGTEATAFNPRAVAALERVGFVIAKGTGENPHYKVRYAKAGPELEVFSKRFGEPPNPAKDFAAVMTCTQADAACPIVKGATLRVSLPYEDPKASDGSPAEAATYDARARQIATEVFYLFSRVKA